MTVKKEPFISDLTVAELWSVAKSGLGLFMVFALVFGLPMILAERGADASASYFGFTGGKWPTWIFYFVVGAIALIWPGYTKLVLEEIAKVAIPLGTWWGGTKLIARVMWVLGFAIIRFMCANRLWLTLCLLFLAISFYEAICTVRGRRQQRPAVTPTAK